jgi:6-phosphogluconolactonase
MNSCRHNAGNRMVREHLGWTGLVMLLAGASLLASASSLSAAEPAAYRVYLGTYTGGGSQGIYTAKFDTATGGLSGLELAGELKNPSFLAVHPTQKYLYAVSEVADADGKPTGAVASLAIDQATGKLTLLNTQSSGGGGPCHVNLDRTGKTAVVANYGGGSVASYAIGDDGRLAPAASVIQHRGSSVDKSRQEAAHAHSIYVDATGKWVLSADLGLDRVMIYKLNPETSQLSEHAPGFVKVAPGAGPRHFAFHPNGKYGYVINELGNTVTVFAWDKLKGTLVEIQTIGTLPTDFTGKSYTAEVVVHPNGKFLYGSNRGHNSLAAFKIDEATGKLTLLGHQPTKGDHPRNFNIDPTGKWILCGNANSDNIVTLKIDQTTGHLTDAGLEQKLSKPVCVKFIDWK